MIEPPLENIMKVVMDSDVLIKFTKTGCMEAIVSLLEVSISNRYMKRPSQSPKDALMQIRFRKTLTMD